MWRRKEMNAQEHQLDTQQQRILPFIGPTSFASCPPNEEGEKKKEARLCLLSILFVWCVGGSRPIRLQFTRVRIDVKVRRPTFSGIHTRTCKVIWASLSLSLSCLTEMRGAVMFSTNDKHTIGLLPFIAFAHIFFIYPIFSLVKVS